MAASVLTASGGAFHSRVMGLIRSSFFTPSVPRACLHTSTALNTKNWERKNRILYPPQEKDEPCRAAEIYHCRRQIKYSKDKMWYLAKLIRGMTIDQALAQLEFNDKKGAKVIKEVLLEAQEMAVKNHNVEYKSNLYVVVHRVSSTTKSMLVVPKTQTVSAKFYSTVLRRVTCILREGNWVLRYDNASAHAESFSAKGKYLKRIRYHGRGMFGIMDKVYCHYFVKLVEGSPPKVELRTAFDQAKEYVEELRSRTIIYSL